MKKFLRGLVLLSLFSPLAGAQTAGNYVFFKGDTLNGFDYSAVQAEAVKHHIDGHDMRGFMSNKQKEFVITKYHLPSSYFNRKSAPVNTILASACNNLDFSTGDYTSWTGGTGYNMNSQAALTVQTAAISTTGVNSPETACSYHTLMNTGTDPYSGLSTVAPGATWSCRLGGEWANLNDPPSLGGNCNAIDPNTLDSYSSGEYIQQTFAVTAANAMFTYKYAVVLLDAGHTALQVPYFRAEVLDASLNPIPCMQYYVEDTLNSPPPGWSVSGTTSTAGSGGSVFYSQWTSNSLNLKTYIGQNVTVRFTCAGCGLGGHWAYAYVCGFCSPIQILASSPEVCLGGTINLTAPPITTGTYAWNTMPTGTAGIVGSTTGQSVTINAAGTYQVTVTQAPGCFYVIDTTLAFYPLPKLTATSTNTSCGASNGTININASGGNAPYTYLWTPAPPVGQGTPNASGLGAGSYKVTVTSANGCTHD
ncbi:MAG: SprB repeat-containing protein, partial [Bacteroidia bacterium]